MYIFTPSFQCKALPLAIFAALVAPGHAQHDPADPFKDNFLSLNNLTSPLPPGWTQFLCWDDCAFDPAGDLLFGAAFSDSVHMTIEACVEFCDAQGSRLAGLKGSGCGCANILNPKACFESNTNSACMDPDRVGLGCPGNRQESCGLDSVLFGSSLVNLFWKQMFTQFSCLFAGPEWPGGAPLTAIGSWRFSYFYNDSSAIHALSRNAAELARPPPFDNLTTVACVTTCNDSGFTLAGLKAGDQCFCGNSIENGASPITDCSSLDSLTRCSGNNLEFCGGTDAISIYTLPGTGLIPMIPFESTLDTFCSSGDCIGDA